MMHAMEQQQERQHGQRDILTTPVWLLAVRIAQVVLCIIVLGLCGGISHDVYLDELGLGIAMSLITVVAVAYMVVSEKVPACQPAYHIVAVVSIEAFMLVLWLATFAAIAARRARFVVDVNVSGCSSNGGLVNSKTCYSKRAILFPAGETMMSAASGIGGLVWILFIVSSVWTLVQFLKGRKQGRFALGSATTAAEPKVEQQQPQQPVQPPAAHDNAQYPTPTQSPSPQSTQQPQPQFVPPPAGTYPPVMGQQQQHPYGQQPSPQPQPYQHQPMGSELDVQPVGSELPAQQAYQPYQQH